MYRVFRVFRDNEGKIFHKVPVGGAKTERDAFLLQDFICCNNIQYTIPKFENKISF